MQQEHDQTALLSLDRINTVEIFILNRTVNGPIPIIERNVYVPTFHLQIVSGDSTPFTRKDLDRMSLNLTERMELYELCCRRRLLLASVYFPDATPEDVFLEVNQNFILEGKIFITFYLKCRPHT